MHTIRFAGCLMALLALAFPAQAQLFRAYLALDGLDTNDCSLATPCRLLPAALAAVQAGGEIWMLDSANYNIGPVTVDRGVTILAIPGALGSVLANGGDAITVATTGSVTLRNLNILPFAGNADRIGVNKDGAGRLAIQDCNIVGFAAGLGVQAQNGAIMTVARSVIRGNYIGLHAGANSDASVSETLFAGNIEYAAVARGLAAAPARLAVTGSVVRNSRIGFAAETFSSAATARLDVTESRLEGSGGSLTTGISASAQQPGSNAFVALSENVISGYEVGVAVFGTGRTFLGANAITDAINGVYANVGTVVESAGNNVIWSLGSPVVGTMPNVGTR